ncbi:hypothetical protein RBSWK_00496 [Rhodopirellula baltica SWK14]|uniref:Uncharacterized protein n=1 Tax=Rhodopirellula baltica SWK14 TaxID=993516 RepID=L7CPN0_RHOBT|nr:hypothetical protein RBSWK_00496 [Rhodopirellula baltica SWK14]
MTIATTFPVLSFMPIACIELILPSETFDSIRQAICPQRSSVPICPFPSVRSRQETQCRAAKIIAALP